jgi:hypothetical protein
VVTRVLDRTEAMKIKIPGNQYRTKMSKHNIINKCQKKLRRTLRVPKKGNSKMMRRKKRVRVRAMETFDVAYQKQYYIRISKGKSAYSQFLNKQLK